MREDTKSASMDMSLNIAHWDYTMSESQS